MAFHELRLQTQGFAVMPSGFVLVVLVPQRIAEIVVGVGKVGANAQRLPAVGLGFGELALFAQLHAQLMMSQANLAKKMAHVKVGAIYPQRLPAERFRLGEIAGL